MSELKRTTPTAPGDGKKDPGENPPNPMPNPLPRDYPDVEITAYKKPRSYGKIAAVVAGLIVLGIIIFATTQ